MAQRSGEPGGAGSTAPGDEQDPPRRTRLANERTYLAWWRSGLSAFTVALGAGKVVPALTKENRWPYVVVGAGFALLGVVFIGYGFVRDRAVGRALAQGDYAPPAGSFLGALAVIGVLLGFALLLILLVMS